MNEKILDIIKKKVDEATMEELEEALQYIEKQIKGFAECVNSELGGKDEQ